ncbi:MAG TPA: nucleoside 2-deoxyribosyltransferase [bacterium]|jgi:nucleoside 2-deoxyribosyltransferase|nr:nucleoside 2-deoxyribosyltransferase [bacterium]
MKFCIIYKYTTTKNKFQLEKNLEQLASILSDMGHDTFIFDRDIKNWQNIEIPREESSKMVFSAMADCDGVIAYVNHNEPSEGMAMEAGYAKALGKKLIMVVKEGTGSPRIRSICDLYIEFEDTSDLKEELENHLNSAFAISQ